MRRVAYVDVEHRRMLIKSNYLSHLYGHLRRGTGETRISPIWVIAVCSVVADCPSHTLSVEVSGDTEWKCCTTLVTVVLTMTHRSGVRLYSI
jgi:hypothetical protein